MSKRTKQSHTNRVGICLPHAAAVDICARTSEKRQVRKAQGKGVFAFGEPDASVWGSATTGQLTDWGSQHANDSSQRQLVQTSSHLQATLLADIVTAYPSMHVLSRTRPQSPTVVVGGLRKGCRQGRGVRGVASLQRDAAPVTGIWGYQHQPCCRLPGLHTTLLFFLIVGGSN